MTARRQCPDFLVRPQPTTDVTRSMPDVYRYPAALSSLLLRVFPSSEGDFTTISELKEKS